VRRFTNKLTGGLIGLSSRFESAAFWRRETTERFGNLTSFGTSLAVSKLIRGGLFHDWLVSLRYDLRQRNREEALVRGAGPSDDLEKAPVSTRTGAIGPQLVIDKRKDRNGRRNPLTPEAGYKVEFRALFADRALLGQDRFVKLGGSAQHFWKPGSRLLLSHGVRYDHGVPLEGVLLPEVERYFAGGDTTVRGFEKDRLATEILLEPLPPLGDVYQLRVLPAGGNVRFIHNLDLQIEVWKLLDIPVASAIFLDTGLVTNSLHRFHPRDLRHALGVARMRWVAPFGSLSVEWAIPLDPKLGDDPRGRFHFNFGLLF
jgi:outer membrane protein assembly factor BamA